MNVSSSISSSIQSTQRPTQRQQTEQVREQTQREEPVVDKAQVAPSQPVVNTQGQTTGRLLNVTA